MTYFSYNLLIDKELENVNFYFKENECQIFHFSCFMNEVLKNVTC